MCQSKIDYLDEARPRTIKRTRFIFIFASEHSLKTTKRLRRIYGWSRKKPEIILLLVISISRRLLYRSVQKKNRFWIGLILSLLSSWQSERYFDSDVDKFDRAFEMIPK